MRFPLRRCAVLLAVCSACASRSTANDASHVDRTVITQEQLLERHFNNAFDAVQALRSNWLQTRGPDSFRSPTQVQVYLDGVRLGGIETLRSIGMVTVAFIRYYDGISAAARWGLDHGQGVIYVSTHAAPAPDGSF